MRSKVYQWLPKTGGVMEILSRSQDVIREELEFWYSIAQEDKSRSDGISHFKVSKRNIF